MFEMKKGHCLFLIVLFVVCAILLTVVGEQTPCAREDLPERVLLTWQNDPSTTQTVSWRTAPFHEHSEAQLALWTGAPDFGDAAITVSADAQAAQTNEEGTAAHYSVKFENLVPNTWYGFRVGSPQTRSEWHRFRTADSSPAGFRFLYFGDVQNDILSLGSRAIREAYAAVPDARFMLFSGDLVQEGYDDGLWDEWARALGFISASIPCVATPGNHDCHRLGEEQVAGPDPLWRRHFAFPLNGPPNMPELEEAAYYIDYQGVRIVSIDSNVFANEDYLSERRDAVREAQFQWLDRVLRDNPCRWIIVAQHHPIFSAGKDRDNIQMRELLVPLYEEAHVDLVLQGHDHYYSRTRKIRRGKIVDAGAAGVIYVTSVCGSKMYPKNPKFEHLMAVMKGGTQLYQIIDIDANRLQFGCYAVSGVQIDSFELRKDPDGRTLLLDHPSPAAACRDS